MNIQRMLRTGALALSVTIGGAYLSGCTDYGGGYYGGGPDVDVGVGFGYYDTGGCCARGGWGRGYRVGPWHGDHRDDHHNDRGGGHGSTHSYRAAPAGRSVPSIPSRGHGGGGHGSPHH
ncbi:MAG TPA: hypothetical protein VH082_03290 [Rudaea sp.]|jgi:hypothetical protein|nr:hypothetical protein [Rudaea sp.]